MRVVVDLLKLSSLEAQAGPKTPTTTATTTQRVNKGATAKELRFFVSVGPTPALLVPPRSAKQREAPPWPILSVRSFLIFQRLEKYFLFICVEKEKRKSTGEKMQNANSAVLLNQRDCLAQQVQTVQDDFYTAIRNLETNRQALSCVRASVQARGCEQSKIDALVMNRLAAQVAAQTTLQAALTAEVASLHEELEKEEGALQCEIASSDASAEDLRFLLDSVQSRMAHREEDSTTQIAVSQHAAWDKVRSIECLLERNLSKGCRALHHLRCYVEEEVLFEERLVELTKRRLEASVTSSNEIIERATLMHSQTTAAMEEELAMLAGRPTPVPPPREGQQRVCLKKSKVKEPSSSQCADVSSDVSSSENSCPARSTTTCSSVPPSSVAVPARGSKASKPTQQITAAKLEKCVSEKTRPVVVAKPRVHRMLDEKKKSAPVVPAPSSSAAIPHAEVRLVEDEEEDADAPILQPKAVSQPTRGVVVDFGDSDDLPRLYH